MTPAFAFRSSLDVYPNVRAVAEAVLRRAWDEVAALLLDFEHARDRSWVMQQIASTSPRLVVPVIEVDTAAGRVPAVDDPAQRTLATLFALCLVYQAWEVRNSVDPDGMSDDQIKRFEDLLVQAEQILVEVVAVEPGQVEAWHVRLVTSRGLELGLAESRRRYARLTAIDDQHVLGHLAMAVELYPGWNGDWPAALELARSVSRSARPGTLVPLVVLDVHFDRWAADGVEALNDQEVIDEIVRAAQASVLHPDFVPVLGWREAHSDLALFFSLVDMYGHAAVHFNALGDEPVEATWCYFSRSREQFEAYRAMAMSAPAPGGR